MSKKYKGHRDVETLDQFIQEMIEAGSPPELVSLLNVISNTDLTCLQSSESTIL